MSANVSRSITRFIQGTSQCYSTLFPSTNQHESPAYSLSYVHRQSLRHGLSSAPSTQLSYVHGPSTEPLLALTLGQALEQSTQRLPDRDAFVFPQQGVRKSFQEFYDDVEKMAAGFLATGMNPGDRLGLWAPNVYEWVVTQFATAMAGLILVNINPAYQRRELEYALEKVGCKGIVTSLKFKTQDYYEMLYELCPEMSSAQPGDLRSRRLPQLRNVYLLPEEKDDLGKYHGFHFWDVRTTAGSDAMNVVQQLKTNLQCDDAVNIQFTSGTTGNPKGATLSHHNIVNNARFIGKRAKMHLDEHTKICVSPPLYHCFGCVGGSLLTVVFGGTSVFPSKSFQPAESLKQVDAEKCTALFGTPTMFIDKLNHPDFDKYDYSSLRTGAMAGAPCPIEVAKACMGKLHMKDFCLVYGTTENSPVTFMTLTTDSVTTRTTTVGVPLDHVEAKVVDLEDRIVPIGQPGTLKTRGYMVMLGYYNDEAKTKETVGPDRWYDTGDTAVINAEGYCSIVGRSKDMIIRGGENIYPTEIEQVLYEHPAIVDVHVFGVPDERMGEEVCAWVRKRSGKELNEDDVKSFLRGKVSHFKIPKYVAFKEEADFPMTITGKVQKFIMRDIAKKELGLDHVASHMANDVTGKLFG